jgi:hypothetical protein
MVSDLVYKFQMISEGELKLLREIQMRDVWTYVRMDMGPLRQAAWS